MWRAFFAVMAVPALLGLLFLLLILAGDVFWICVTGLGFLGWISIRQTFQSPVRLFGPQRFPAVPWNGFDVLLAFVCLFVLQNATAVFWTSILHGEAGGAEQSEQKEQSLVAAWQPAWVQLSETKKQQFREALSATSVQLGDTDQLERLCIIEFARQRQLVVLVTFQSSLMFVVVLLVYLVKIRGVRLYQLGLNGHRFAKNVWLGLGAYLLSVPPVLLTLQLAMSLFGSKQHPIDQVLRSDPDAWMFILTVLSAVVIAPVSEELMFRGTLQSWLRRLCGPRHAIAVSSFAFAAMHFDAWPSPIPLFVLALFLGYLAVRTRCLVAPITLHAFFNAVNLLPLVVEFRG